MKNSLLSAAVSLFLVIAAFSAGAVVTSVSQQSQTAAVAEATLAPVVVPSASLQAKAAILYDPTSGQVLYQKNAQVAMPLASLTKLMTAQAVLASRDPSTQVGITVDNLKPEGDWGFRVGDTVVLGDLLRFGLVASSNDAMAAAAASLGSGYLTAMNQTAVALGLTKTYFNNSTGLDLSGDTAGAYGSAYDVARMTANFYKQYPSLFGLTTQPSVTIDVGSRTLTAKATSVPLQDIPGFAGGKTGYTDLAGGNLAAVFDLDIGRPIVAVVLHSTESGRFVDIRTLINAARLAQKATALSSTQTP